MNITLIIIIITSIISISAFSNPNLSDKMVFYPPAVANQNEWHRFLTCALVHADWFHLIFNMVSLYSFGGFVEGSFETIFGSLGPVLYIALYVISQFLCMIPTYTKHKNDYHYRSLGASGAVSAVIFAGIFLSPLSKVSLFILPFGVPGFIFGFLYLALTAYLDRRGAGGINHSAHLFGSLAGIGLLIIFGYAFSHIDLFQNFIAQVRSFTS